MNETKKKHRRRKTALIKMLKRGQRSSEVGSSLIEEQGRELTIRGYHWKCDFNLFIIFDSI